MPQELSLWDILRVPATFEKIEMLEPWLYASAQGDHLFPVICNTPILHTDTDAFMHQYGSAVLKAMAAFGHHEESREWFLKRYGMMFPEMPVIDSLIEGEGYPGFLDQLNLPSFLLPFEMETSDAFIFDLVGKHHPDLGLDLGCGQGGMAYRMSRVCTKVIGVDSHFFLAAMANHFMKADSIPFHFFDPVKGRSTGTLAKKPVDNVDIICADARDLPFSEPLFDWIHLGHFVDLISDPEVMLDHLIKILKPGGTLSVSTPMDFEEAGHLDEFVSMLNEDFTCTHYEESRPWLRYNHKRRWVVHEDWIWIGKLRKQTV